MEAGINQAMASCLRVPLGFKEDILCVQKAVDYL